MFFAKVDGMEFRSQGADFGDSGPYELFLNTLVERAMERYDSSCGDPYHFAASWISDQALGVDIEATNQIEDEIVVHGFGPIKKSMSPVAKSIQVAGYTKKDGTVVKPYDRDGDKKAEESSSPKSKKEEKPSVLHSRREGETDLDYFSRVYEAASGRLGDKEVEQFYGSLPPSVQKSDSDAAMHLQLYVLRHSLDRLLPNAGRQYLDDFLGSLLDGHSDSRERKAVDRIGGLDEFVKAAEQIPYGLQQAVKYNTERIEAGNPIGFGARRDIHYAGQLKAFLDYAADPMAIRNALSDVIKSGDHPYSLTESLQSVSKQFWMATSEGTRKQEMFFAIEENIHEFKMGELYYLKSMLDSSDVNVSMLADLVDSRMGDLVPALMHNELEGEPIDPEDALSELDALLEHTDGFPLFHTKVMDRYEYWENEKIRLEKQARAKQVREMVLANANVNREQQAANDAVLKSQYSEVEGRLKEIAGSVKSPADYLSGEDEKDVQTAVRLFSIMPNREYWSSFDAAHSPDATMANLMKEWIEAAEWEEVEGNPVPERDIEILRSLLASPQEARLLLGKYKQRHDSVRNLVRSVKKNDYEGNSNELNRITLERFLRNSGSGMSVDEAFESIKKEIDDTRLMNQDSFGVSLVVGNLVDLGKGLAFKSPDGEIDQSSLELFKGTTSDKAYADAQAIAKKIQSERQAEIFKERLEAGLLSESTAKRSGDNESYLNRKIASEVWGGWKSSSTTPMGKAMQLAAVDEFGVLGKPEYEIDREAIIAGVGEEYYDLIKIHLRATWEATQYLLKATGKDNVTMWRGLQISASELGLSDEMKAAPRLKKFKLDNLKLLRNGLSSATTDPSVANEWGGIGELPRDARRVVIRIDAGAEDILSLPVFGDNVHSEQEVLPMGSRWNRWDAWLNVAPDSPDADWTPEPNESKSMITEIEGERIIEFDGGGGWLEGYGEIDEELEVIGDEAFELAAEEGNQEVASVLKSIGQAMLEFTERKAVWIKPYTKGDGTKVSGYWSKKDKRDEGLGKAKRIKAELEDWLKLSGSKEEWVASVLKQHEDSRELYESTGTPFPSSEKIASDASSEYDKKVAELERITHGISSLEGHSKDEEAIKPEPTKGHESAALLRTEYKRLGSELRMLGNGDKDKARRLEIESSMAKAMTLIEEYHASYTEFSIDAYHAEKEGGGKEFLREVDSYLYELRDESMQQKFDEGEEELNEYWSELRWEDRGVYDEHSGLVDDLVRAMSSQLGLAEEECPDVIEDISYGLTLGADFFPTVEYLVSSGTGDGSLEERVHDILSRSLENPAVVDAMVNLQNLYEDWSESRSYEIAKQDMIDSIVHGDDEFYHSIDEYTGEVHAGDDARGFIKSKVADAIGRGMKSSESDQAEAMKALFPDRSGASLAQAALDTWAQSSSNGTLGSLALQEAVRLKYGGKFGIESLHGDPDVVSEAREALKNPAVARAMEALVTEIYEYTQDQLPEGNYVMYRGMAWGDPPPELEILFNNEDALFDKTLDVPKNGKFTRNQAPSRGGVKSPEWGSAVVSDTPPEQNPMSSYSLYYGTAQAFAGSTGAQLGGWRGEVNHRAMLVAIVPKERIFSTFMTGPGCTTESEAIIIGGDPPPTRMVLMKDANLPDTVEGLEEFLSV